MTLTYAVRALGKAEFVAISRSWFVRSWALIALIFALLPALSASGKGDFMSEIVGGWLVVYFIPSAIVCAIFGASAITQDAETAADSILTRAVTRLDYVAAKLVARTAVVAAIHGSSTIPMLYFAQRWGLDDSTTMGLVAASLMTGLMLVFLTAVGVFTGTILRNLAAAVVVIMIAFSAESLIFGFLEIREFSPTHVLDDLPSIIRGDSGAWKDLRTMAAFFAASAAAGLGAAYVLQRREF